MRPVRLLLVGALVVAIFGLTVWWQGDPTPGAETSDAVEVPAAGNSDDLSSTWFCTASSVGTEGTPAHYVILTNPGNDPVSASLTAYGAKGVVATEQVDVAPSAPL